MDAMYLNLMFINPRTPVGAGAKGARCTRPSLAPPPPAKNPGSAPAHRSLCLEVLEIVAHIFKVEDHSGV